MDNTTNNTKMIDSLARRTAGHFGPNSQGHCAAHILNLSAQAVLSVFRHSQVDSFDADMNSDLADFELPLDQQPQGDEDDEAAHDAEDEADDDFAEMPDLVDDDNSDDDDASFDELNVADNSTCFLQKVCNNPIF